MTMITYTVQSEYPVPVVKVIVENENGQILLARRRVEPYRGKWTIFGGRMQVQDDNLEKRGAFEVKEQTGLAVEVTHLLDVRADLFNKRTFDPRFFVVKIVYVAKLLGGALRLGDKTSELKWFTMAEALKQKKQIGFDHADIIAALKKRQSKLIPIDRSFYTEWYGKEFLYGQRQYPRLACMAIIMNDQKELLLGLRARKPYVDCWNFPGGHIYVGESPEECIKRELQEELGVASEAVELVGVYSDKGQHPKHADVGVYYFVKIWDQHFVRNIEMKEFGYFSLDKLPGKIAYQNRMVMADIRRKLQL